MRKAKEGNSFFYHFTLDTFLSSEQIRFFSVLPAFFNSFFFHSLYLSPSIVFCLILPLTESWQLCDVDYDKEKRTKWRCLLDGNCMNFQIHTDVSEKCITSTFTIKIMLTTYKTTSIKTTHKPLSDVFTAVNTHNHSDVFLRLWLATTVGP